jgi:drug/metabolite transporter (DMT)-like permease
MSSRHGRAVAWMVLATLLWSTAGVVSRHLDSARGLEVTFWRSAFTALTLAVLLPLLQGAAFWRTLRRGGRALWLSGACWAVMFTAFMAAMMLTRVADVLVTMALGPLVTALFARLFLHHHLPARTWGAIAVGGLGIAAIALFGQDDAASAAALTALTSSTRGLGLLIALAVPVAGALNFTLLQKVSHRGYPARLRGNPDEDAGSEVPTRPDMLPSVLIGGVLSAVATAAVLAATALPLQASLHDLGLLAGLGAFQLALPCLLVVRLTRVLPAPEIALLGLLEVVFGVLWAWLGAGETPGAATLIGGGLILAALIGNEVLALRDRQA